MTGTVRVPAGETLVVQPGVQVRFASNTGLVVQGTLTADGTADDPITFTSAETTPEAGQWQGIEFRGGSSGVLDHCRILHAGYDMLTEGDFTGWANAAVVCRVDAAPTVS